MSTVNLPGRQAPTSEFVQVSSDGSVINASTFAGTYNRAAAVNATPGNALWVQNVTTAGTISVTLSGGGTLTPTVGLGSTILPFGVTAASLGTAVGGTFNSLFFA